MRTHACRRRDAFAARPRELAPQASWLPSGVTSRRWSASAGRDRVGDVYPRPDRGHRTEPAKTRRLHAPQSQRSGTGASLSIRALTELNGGSTAHVWPASVRRRRRAWNERLGWNGPAPRLRMAGPAMNRRRRHPTAAPAIPRARPHPAPSVSPTRGPTPTARCRSPTKPPPIRHTARSVSSPVHGAAVGVVRAHRR